MEFHHRKGEAKVASVSRLIAESRPTKTIMAEVAKCDLVCANCHAISDDEAQAQRRVM
jgi:hypothetical protein